MAAAKDAAREARLDEELRQLNEQTEKACAHLRAAQVKLNGLLAAGTRIVERRAPSVPVPAAPPTPVPLVSPPAPPPAPPPEPPPPVLPPAPQPNVSTLKTWFEGRGAAQARNTTGGVAHVCGRRVRRRLLTNLTGRRHPARAGENAIEGADSFNGCRRGTGDGDLRSVALVGTDGISWWFHLSTARGATLQGRQAGSCPRGMVLLVLLI